MFDLTKQIQLPQDFQKKYVIARTTLHVVFFVGMTYVAYRILFPIIPFDFSLNNPNSNKNTLVSPRLAQTGEFPKKGIIESGGTLLFNANPFGQFSNATVTLTASKKQTTLEGTVIKISRSFQAFFYPTAKAIGFKNGTLLTTPNGAYYLISDGMARKFANTDIILQLGYPKSAFINVNENDLTNNPIGNEISNSATYPNDSIFKVDETFYQLKDGEMTAFISPRAFLSQFKPEQAIAKNADFLSGQKISEKYLGFSDGTLGSSADSVFILSEDKSYPVADAETFNQMGLNWNDVIPLNQDELSIYARQKQFTVDAPHPNGTVFLDQDSKEYFIIKDGAKLLVPSKLILETYSKNSAVLASTKQAKQETSCVLTKNFLSSNSYSCQLPLDNLINLSGNDYQISSEFKALSNLTDLNATFSTPLSFDSFKNSLAKIKNAIKNR
jgi:hypothetical protein